MTCCWRWAGSRSRLQRKTWKKQIPAGAGICCRQPSYPNQYGSNQDSYAPYESSSLEVDPTMVSESSSLM